MRISWQEIRKRALAFTSEWKNESRERAEAQSFWNDFFNIFGLSRRRLASFEQPVKKLDGNQGFIDLFWKGVLIVEHKSKGADLDLAHDQAYGYFPNLEQHELPQYILVSDFTRFKLYSLEDGQDVTFHIEDLSENIHHLSFIAGYGKKKNYEDIPVNIKAAKKLGELHTSLSNFGYKGHELEVLITRLLFCFFADDAGIFEKKIFAEYLREQTREDGSDLGDKLSSVFQVLNKPVEKRQINISDELNAFPYINGGLFSEITTTSHFDSCLRNLVLECAAFNWSSITPAIFGSLFQFSIIPEKRRDLGSYYTSEDNILKILSPLVLNSLYQKFDELKNLRTHKETALLKLLSDISKLTFLDPACGCGNFLVVAYRELRMLEILIIQELKEVNPEIANLDSKVSTENFYGIEVEELPARIAETALWLTDHQMNMLLIEECGVYRETIPLSKRETIANEDAITFNWNTLVKPCDVDFIIGNPPYKGSNNSTEEKRLLLKEVTGTGKLDSVCMWFFKAAEFIKDTDIEVAYVATNSIVGGEQADLLWNPLIMKHGISINFAYKSFKWNNEGPANAAVHVVIVCFAVKSRKSKFIYSHSKSNVIEKALAFNISPNLVDADNYFIGRRKKPLSDVPEIRKGNQPTDGGFLLLSDEEKEKLVSEDDRYTKLIKRIMGSREMIHDKKLWCFWLVGVPPSQLKNLTFLKERLKKVQDKREKSTDPATRKRAATPGLFREQNNPESYIAIPTTTKEQRKYLTVKFLDSNVIPNNNLFIVPEGTWYHFAILSSSMHRLWTEYVCGRTDNRNRYSKEIGYNNFPWPEVTCENVLSKIEAAAKEIVRERNKIGWSLADLYDPLFMPPTLLDAHLKLDKLVEKCYSDSQLHSEVEKLRLLFNLHQCRINKSKTI